MLQIITNGYFLIPLQVRVDTKEIAENRNLAIFYL